MQMVCAYAASPSICSGNNFSQQSTQECAAYTRSTAQEQGAAALQSHAHRTRRPAARTHPAASLASSHQSTQPRSQLPRPLGGAPRAAAAAAARRHEQASSGLDAAQSLGLLLGGLEPAVAELAAGVHELHSSGTAHRVSSQPCRTGTAITSSFVQTQSLGPSCQYMTERLRQSQTM